MKYERELEGVKAECERVESELRSKFEGEIKIMQEMATNQVRCVVCYEIFGAESVKHGDPQKTLNLEP